MFQQSDTTIAIRFSNNSYGGEIDLSGLPKDLRAIQQAIISLLQDESQQICVIQSNLVDPSPYDMCLNSLSIDKTGGSIKISVSDSVLHIAGEPENLEAFASWFDFEDDTWSGYHCHFERLGHEDWVDETSISLVIAVKNSIKRS